MAKADEYVVGIDVGSSKVAVLIGKRDAGGELEIAGRGLAPNRGTRRGNIVNLEAAVEALKAASEEAEVMAGVEISRAWVGIAGADVRSFNVRGMVSVARKDREISRADIQRSLEAAQSAALPSDREILHAMPQEFVVDEQGGIADPLGMLGTRLEVQAHLVSGQTARSRTLLTCVNRAGIEVAEMVFEPLVVGEAVLTPDEKDLGVLVLDVGSGTTGWALFEDGEPRHSGVAPVGAGHFTNDLAMVLRTPYAEAEKIKLKEGCCLTSMVDEEEGISVPAVAGGAARVVPRREICEILEPRAEELLALVREELTRSGWDGALRGGVVLTGGGAQLEGLLEQAGQIFGASVRYGLPFGLGGLVDVLTAPSWSTSAGLIKWAVAADSGAGRPTRRTGFRMKNFVGSLRNVFSDLL
jgi:cell division protein FtsA